MSSPQPSGPESGPRVFVSYRRDDSKVLAGRLKDRVARRFGATAVLFDDGIGPGVVFRSEVNRALETAVVLLAVIGPGWVDGRGEGGVRRLDDPDDLAVHEIGKALRRGISVIPVLAENTDMPGETQLREPMRTLADRNARSLRHLSFEIDVATRLTDRATLLEDLSESHSQRAADRVGPEGWRRWNGDS